MWVDLPLPSVPSKVMKIPFISRDDVRAAEEGGNGTSFGGGPLRRRDDGGGGSRTRGDVFRQVFHQRRDLPVGERAAFGFGKRRHERSGFAVRHPGLPLFAVRRMVQRAQV